MPFRRTLNRLAEWPAAQATVVLLATLVLGCSDSTGPRIEPFVLALGVASEGRVANGDTLVYQLNAEAGQLFIVPVEAKDGAIAVQVRDPLGADAGFAFDTGPAVSVPTAQWNLVTVATTGVYAVRVTPSGPSSGGRFVLHPVQSNPAPEHHAALIQVGDTVSGEMIDGRADVDDYFFDAQAGQEINIFLQKLGAPEGTVWADLLFDQSATRIFNVGRVGASTPADLEFNSSGPLTLVAGRYRLRIRTLTFTSGVYTGAYRFQVSPISHAPVRIFRDATVP